MKIINILIVLESGMLIGSGNDSFELGGVDSTTILDAKKRPYIPASSLKGKLRYLLKLDNKEKGKIEEIFGERTHSTSDESKSKNPQLTQKEMNEKMIQRSKKAIFSDQKVDEESIKNNNGNYFEEKYENTIDENNNAIPRLNKRTVSGLKFSGVIRLNDDSHLEVIKKALCLLKNDYIGGNGSRGYGWIRSICIDGEEIGDNCEQST